MNLIQRIIKWFKPMNEPNHPVYTRTGDRWDQEEIARLKAFRKNGADWEEISALIHRTAAACKNKYYRVE